MSSGLESLGAECTPSSSQAPRLSGAFPWGQIRDVSWERGREGVERRPSSTPLLPQARTLLPPIVARLASLKSTSETGRTCHYLFLFVFSRGGQSRNGML